MGDDHDWALDLLDVVADDVGVVMHAVTRRALLCNAGQVDRPDFPAHGGEFAAHLHLNPSAVPRAVNQQQNRICHHYANYALQQSD
jgi:hypothetical protein